ncbi:Actin filament-associated protein 1-like 2 [Dissostichus eleginoides]|uniref:Actin filament-associated protein 1-like 2 n=1 Tax=Dissostichus eleginoides TaxID=100907 RepID=A0AAD9FC70_DISEL|nr:Actin filament-associated protein 1-like 2 [Dissostichus eleginoides]
MDKQKVLAKLIWDLPSFLSALDSEKLSYAAQTQKKDISELLSKLHTNDTPVEDTEYMIMSCPSSSDTPGSEGVQGAELLLNHDLPLWLANLGLVVPPVPPGGPGGDEDEDTYEEAEPYLPNTTTSNTENAESDSSHYESYGEEDDDDEPVKDRAHYIHWSASQPCLRPVPESRLCGYLWKRKWLGQWTKQLFIIRSDVLLDLLPQLELSLRGCQLVYKSKSSGKIQHQLKLLLLGSESLVLGYSSFQQAAESDTLLSGRSSLVQTDSEEERASAVCSLNKDKGFLSVLMNCQWQSLRCRYTVQLRGCEVRAGPDTDHSYRITLSKLGDQVAVLEVSSSGEKERWLKLLQDGAAKTQENTDKALSGLQTQRFPNSNTYMDDPFHLSGTYQDQPIYSNTSILDHMLHSSQDSVRPCSVSSKDSVTYSNTTFSSHNRKSLELERGVQKLELTGKRTVQLRAGSEINLTSAGKPNKRTSFRQSLAICSERAQAGFLNPLLRRTASAKNSLRRAPSSLFIEHGKVFQKRKEWETKAAA